MLKKIKNQNAQANFGEYALLILIVIGMITAMGIFFRRAIQGRLRDARLYMFKIVDDRVARSSAGVGGIGGGGGHLGHGSLNGSGSGGPGSSRSSNLTLWIEYEPYYLNQTSIVDRYEEKESRVTAGTSSGVFRQDIYQSSTIDSLSVTAPPVNSNLTDGN